MAEQVLMPKVGATMESGTILKWFKEEGEPVVKGEPLLEIMTDKISMELEAESNGILLKVLSQADEVIPVHQVIAYIGKAGEDIQDSLQQTELASSGLSSVNEEPAGGAAEADPLDPLATKPRRTPAARILAEKRGIELRQVKGTGPNGRIHRRDVVSFIEDNYKAIKATPLARKIAVEHRIDLAKVNGSGANGKIVRDDVQKVKKSPQTEVASVLHERIKMEGIRKVIAQRMVQSVNTAPHVTLVSEVDMLRCTALRKELLPVIEKQTGYRLSYTEILVKFVAHALRRHPMVNATLKDEYIVLNPQVNIGLAVSVSQGLVVPVVRNADEKGLRALTEECKGLGSLAREGKLKPEQMTGGTFTISNLGMYAVDAFTPIINQPESAILGVGRIQEKAVGVDGVIQLRPMMTLSLSFDHRVIDGAPAAAFLTDLKEILENPYQVLA